MLDGRLAPIAERQQAHLRMQLDTAKARLAHEPTHPELVTGFAQAFFDFRGVFSRKKIEVPIFPLDKSGLEELHERGREVFYVPPEMSTMGDFQATRESFPSLRHPFLLNHVADGEFIQIQNATGWLHSQRSPVNKEEAQFAIYNGRERGINLFQFLLQAEEQAELTGKYPEKGDTTILLGTAHTALKRPFAGEFRPTGNDRMVTLVISAPGQLDMEFSSTPLDENPGAKFKTVAQVR